tara:strand:- start:506 stop:655 length:150 start_codon:yes stop_codon:yes gene_type:complete
MKQADNPEHSPLPIKEISPLLTAWFSPEELELILSPDKTERQEEQLSLL